MKGIDLVLLTKFQSLETPDDGVIVQIGGIFLENLRASRAKLSEFRDSEAKMESDFF